MVEKFYYSMGEVTEMFDVEPTVIRYWCKQFSCLNPKRNAKGNRMFTPQDVERLKRIYHLLKEKRMTIKGAQKAMRKRDFSLEGSDPDVALLEQLQTVRAILVEMRDSLGEPMPEELVVPAEDVAEPIAAPVVETVAAQPVEQVEDQIVEQVEEQVAEESDEPTIEEQVEEQDIEVFADEVADEVAEEVAEENVEEVAEVAEEVVDVATEAVAEAVVDVATEAVVEVAEEPTEVTIEDVFVETPKERVQKKKRASRRKLIGEEGVVERPLFPFYEQTLF